MFTQKLGPWKNNPWTVDIYAELGWNVWNLPKEANGWDLNDFFDKIAEDAINRNHPWLMEERRSSDQIRKVLFNIRHSSPYGSPRQLMTINKAMVAQDYVGKGKGLDLWWTDLGTY